MVLLPNFVIPGTALGFKMMLFWPLVFHTEAIIDMALNICAGFVMTGTALGLELSS